MSAQKIGILLVLLLIVGGCRTTQNDRCERAIALLRAEKIDLEDRYYELEAKLEAVTGGYDPGLPVRDSNRIELQTPSDQFDHRDHQWSPKLPSTVEELPPARESSRLRSRNQSPSMTEVPEIIIETGDFSVPDQSLVSKTERTALNEPTFLLPAPNNETTLQASTASNPRPAVEHRLPTTDPIELANHIVDVVVDYDFKQRRPLGSWLIVQPVDQQSQAIPLVGEIVLSIIQSNASPLEQRVGLWKYDHQRVETWIQDQVNQIPGIHVPRPAILSQRDVTGLMAFVRYTAPDQQVFEISFPLDRLPEQIDDDVMAAGNRDEPKVEREAKAASGDRNESLEWSPFR